MPRVPASLSVLLLLLSSQPSPGETPTLDDVAYDWRNVLMQGGGYATSILIHPLDARLIYMRTDVAGFYRWDADAERWIQLTDQLITDDPASDFWLATESVAVDPTDTNKVFISAGGWGSGGVGRILRSHDQGRTWSAWITPFEINGNGDGRWGGERLAVDPNNPAVLYYGTRAVGIYKSTDGAAGFSPLAGFGPRGDGNYGVQWIAIDKDGGRTRIGGLAVSRLIYAGVNGGDDQGIYRSTDGGQTWSRLAGHRSNRGQIAPDGTLWVGAAGDGLLKMPRGGEAFSNVAPLADKTYGPIGIDPRDPDHLVISTSGGHGDQLFRSTDAGKTWKRLEMSFANRNPATTGGNASAVSSVAISPADSGQVWYTDWYNAWQTRNVADPAPVFISRSEGYEALVILAMCSPSAGVPLFSGGADHSIFRHESLNVVPTVKDVAGVWEITGIDFCEADPDYIAAVGGKGWEGSEGGGGGTSTDNGATFTDWANIGTSAVGLVAVGAAKQENDHPFIVWLPKGEPPKRSTDGGQSWDRSEGAPASAYNDFFAAHQVLVSDRVNGSTFYLLDRGNADLYRSTDGGARWERVLTFDSGAYEASIDAVPGVEGGLWVALDRDGLWRVTGGAKATKIPAVEWARHVTLGKPRSADAPPALYIHGGIAGARGIFRSEDNGESWVRIYDQSTQKKGVYKEIKMLEGDRQTFGRVYVATGGRGVWVGELAGGESPPPPGAPVDLTATAGDGQVSLAWKAAPGADGYVVKRGFAAGGPYGIVQSGLTQTTCTDAGLINGGTYHYVVTAISAAGESAASNEASATPLGSTRTIVIPRAAAPPAVDGEVDALWSTATAHVIGNISGSVRGHSDLSATWKGLWDGDHLYLLAEITDDSKRNDSADPWADDSVELYLDGNNDKAPSYDANDRQFIFGWGDRAVVEGAGRDSAGVSFATADPSPTSYRIEIKVPWNALGVTPAAGAVIGIDVHVNDDDHDSPNRDGKLMGWDTRDAAWNDPALLGTALLQP